VATKKQTRSRAAASQTPAPRKGPILPIVGGAVAIALIVTILVTFGGDESSAETGDPIITGSALPLAVENQSDAGIGLRIPAVTGADFEGNPVTIDPDDGRIKVVLFIAHWCPFCQAEVPLVQDSIAAGALPAEIDFYSVATGISPTRENYPPSAWLEREEWNLPVIVDDAASTIANSFGLTAYPFWVFVDDQGNVMGRVTGSLGSNLTVLFDSLVADGTS
jgi:thiol-disulfide isomerase/thioredoxin